ncbi:hypothetical protein [Streptosporangium canum]|uniref:hypothetical protein n=1 Tax=Streptosporangium canum TaxID=324952 RepID=UPI0037B40C74
MTQPSTDNSTYGATLLDALLAAPGSRNHTLNAARALGQLVGADLLPRPLAEDALTTAGHAAGLSAREVATTVRSGLDAGQRRPRQGAA